MSAFLGAQQAASDSQLAKGGRVKPRKRPGGVSEGHHLIIVIGRLRKRGLVSDKAHGKRRLP